MLIVQTPLRLSFVGGGTDFPSYYEEYGGEVISTSIDKYCYHIIRNFPPFFPHKNQFTYSIIERFNNYEEVKHPALKEALKLLKNENIHIVYDSDLPARSGLGTSSSFAVGLLNGLHLLKNERKTKIELAEEAVYLERKLCREPGGVQDQYAVAVGGFNHILFTKNGVSINSIEISEERKNNLVLL